MKRVADLLRLDGRVAIVTGGAGHIGRACGEALAEAGAAVAVVDLDGPASADTARALERHAGGSAAAIAEDLSDGASAERIVARTLERFGRLDIVVHNAALTGASGVRGYAVPFAEQTLEAWDAAIRINLTAAFTLAKAARSALEASGRGVLLNVGSIYGVVGPNMGLYADTPMGNPAAYAATKGGLVQLTRYLATVLAPHIRANAISPGGIARGQAEAFVGRYEALTPLRRMGTEEDLKGAVAYLASDASAYVTGQNLLVDGGWTAW